MRSLNFKQLHYFLLIAKRGSIAAAARELDIAQPAISLQLANLERELKVTLFERNFKGAHLTPAGKIFVTHAERILEVANKAKLDLQSMTFGATGTVRVGVLPSIGNVLSIPLIAAVKARYPHLELDISSGPSYSVKGWLENNKIDIALTYEQEVHFQTMNAIPLIEEYLYLVVGNELVKKYTNKLQGRKEISFWELSEFELLIPGEKDALGKFIQSFESTTGVALKHDKAYSGQLMTGLRQVMQGEGMMILPSSAIYHLEELDLVTSIKIINPEMKRKVYAVTARHTSLSNAVLTMRDIILDVVQQEQEAKHWRGEISKV